MNDRDGEKERRQDSLRYWQEVGSVTGPNILGKKAGNLSRPPESSWTSQSDVAATSHTVKSPPMTLLNSWTQLWFKMLQTSFLFASSCLQWALSAPIQPSVASEEIYTCTILTHYCVHRV